MDDEETAEVVVVEKMVGEETEGMMENRWRMR